MQQLNFPSFDFQIISESGETKIFDTIRKKYVQLTPEEWVRQHVVRYLIENKGYPQMLIQVEGSIKVGKMNKRCDVIAYNKQMQPILLVECKRSDVELTQEVFDQIFRYNLRLGVSKMFVTNGIKHYCISVLGEKVEFLSDVPYFEL